MKQHDIVFLDIEIIDNYLGCYDDDVNDRDLDGHSFDIDGIDDSEKCIDACGHLGTSYYTFIVRCVVV